MLLHVRHLPVVTESLFDDGLGPVLAYPSRIAPRAAVGLEPLTWAQTSDLPTLQGFGSTFFCSLCRTMCASGKIHRPQQHTDKNIKTLNILNQSFFLNWCFLKLLKTSNVILVFQKLDRSWTIAVIYQHLSFEA